MYGVKRKFTLAVTILSVFMAFAANAATSEDVNSFNILAKYAVDRNTTDVKTVIDEVAEAIKDEFDQSRFYSLKPISATENMEGLDVVDIVEFPEVDIQGTTEYAALVELWSSKDDYFLKKLSPKYGINAPWAVSVYSVSGATLQMLSVAHPELDMTGNEDKLTDYIVVAALNPMAISKVGYSDLSRFENLLFNAHCKSLESQIKSGVKNALYYETSIDWDMGDSGFFWFKKPAFSIDPLLEGLDITAADVASLPATIATPSVTIPGGDAEDVANALKSYMQATAPMYKTGGQMENFNLLVRQFMGELFAWTGQAPFEGTYDNPMYNPSDPNSDPFVDVYFSDVADLEANLPALLNMFFMPVWTGQNPAQMPLMTQGWKFPRAFALGSNDEVQIIELCTMFYAQMALGTGMHHSPAMPCMAGVYQDGDDAVAQMFTAKATFSAFFKDSVTAMGTMNMDVQTYLFALFPEIIYNDVAAMYNGAFQQAGIAERFEIHQF
jgi:hypothetical protein